MVDALEFVFCLSLVVYSFILYRNSLDGTFVWDDRAAVVKNGDVLGTTAFLDLFVHDFWGADISLHDSHKSYRPVTVTTFRMDHNLYGLHSSGFHLTNTIVYALCCLSVYLLLKQWLPVAGARMAAMLFLCHPVHVEAVTSIVGRADSLCGLFYVLALVMYTNALRSSSSFSSAVNTGIALVLAALATLSKEIGYTVVGVFVAIEGIEAVRVTHAISQSTKETPPDKQSWSSAFSLISTAALRCLTSLAFYIRLLILAVISAVYFTARARLHGGNMVYQWTIMENHVHHLPGLLERSLSYAQYHYLYLWKLLYPAQLCFDYGFACIPTVHTLGDTLNLRPLCAYTVVLMLAFYAVRYVRVNLLVGLVMLLVPLTPALNVFVPVGVLVAERLLFMPSLGFCILVVEVLSVDCVYLWEKLWCPSESGMENRNKISEKGKQNSEHERRNNEGNIGRETAGTPQPASPTKEKKVTFASPSSSKKKKGTGHNNDASKSGEAKSPNAKATDGGAEPTAAVNLTPTPSQHPEVPSASAPGRRWQICLWVLLLPVLALYSMRVISRNADWADEFSLYKSGLQVCPRSLKVLTNYALLAMARGQLQEGLDAALKAVEIYPSQKAALINAGVAYQKLGQFGESAEMFQRCLEVDPNMGKAAGYLGVSYYHWASVQSSPSAARLLREEALQALQKAINMGFQAPQILHLTGSTLIDLGRSEESIMYYEAALQQSANYASYYNNKGVPILLEDDIQPENTLNQLGSVYWTLRNVDKAVEAFERGLQVAPHSIPIVTNLGNIYRELGNVERARALMAEGIRLSGSSTPPALYNNLGLLELNAGNFGAAKGLFEQAMRALRAEQVQAVEGGATWVGADGTGAESVILANIQRAEEGMRQRQQ